MITKVAMEPEAVECCVLVHGCLNPANRSEDLFWMEVVPKGLTFPEGFYIHTSRHTAEETDDYIASGTDTYSWENYIGNFEDDFIKTMPAPFNNTDADVNLKWTVADVKFDAAAKVLFELYHTSFSAKDLEEKTVDVLKVIARVKRAKAGSKKGELISNIMAAQIDENTIRVSFRHMYKVGVPEPPLKKGELLCTKDDEYYGVIKDIEAMTVEEEQTPVYVVERPDGKLQKLHYSYVAAEGMKVRRLEKCRVCKEAIEYNGKVWIHSAGGSPHRRIPTYHAAAPEVKVGQVPAPGFENRYLAELNGYNKYTTKLPENVPPEIPCWGCNEPMVVHGYPFYLCPNDHAFNAQTGEMYQWVPCDNVYHEILGYLEKTEDLYQKKFYPNSRLREHTEADAESCWLNNVGENLYVMLQPIEPDPYGWGPDPRAIEEAKRKDAEPEYAEKLKCPSCGANAKRLKPQNLDGIPQSLRDAVAERNKKGLYKCWKCRNVFEGQPLEKKDPHSHEKYAQRSHLSHNGGLRFALNLMVQAIRKGVPVTSPHEELWVTHADGSREWINTPASKALEAKWWKNGLRPLYEYDAKMWLEKLGKEEAKRLLVTIPPPFKPREVPECQR